QENGFSPKAPRRDIIANELDLPPRRSDSNCLEFRKPREAVEMSCPGSLSKEFVRIDRDCGKHLVFSAGPYVQYSCGVYRGNQLPARCKGTPLRHRAKSELPQNVFCSKTEKGELPPFARRKRGLSLIS